MHYDSDCAGLRSLGSSVEEISCNFGGGEGSNLQECEDHK
jgi:hypothetical protein